MQEQEQRLVGEAERRASEMEREEEKTPLRLPPRHVRDDDGRKQEPEAGGSAQWERGHQYLAGRCIQAGRFHL